MESTAARYYTGTSGLLLPVPNKSFYPPDFQERSRLCYYGSLYNSIEINSSFYKIPLGRTLTRWAEDVPESFTFTFKLFKGITHNKGLEFSAEDVQTFMTAINTVGEKRGCLLVQFPGSFRPAFKHRLEMLLYTIRDQDPDGKWPVAIEFRHEDWYRDATYELLERHGAVAVMHDKLKQGLLIGRVPEADVIYLRFHGPGGNYRGSYEDDVLYEYGSYIETWLEEGKRVFAYFNNTMGNAISNLELLRRIVQPV